MQEERELKTYAAQKGGKCKNASHRDGGRVIHAVDEKPTRGGPSFTCAKCGAKPGKKGYGWYFLSKQETQKIDCPKCLEKLET